MKMSFATCLAIGMMLFTWSGSLSRAEEAAAEVNLGGCCDKQKEAGCSSCKHEGEECSESACASCKEECGDCSKSDCSTCKHECSDCTKEECSTTACKGCEKSQCDKAAAAAAACSKCEQCPGETAACDKGQKGDCASGCCKKKCEGAACCEGADKACQEACQHCDAAKKTVCVVLDLGGIDFAAQAACDRDAMISSVLRGTVLPHPVNFAVAETPVCQLPCGENCAEKTAAIAAGYVEATAASPGAVRAYATARHKNEFTLAQFQYSIQIIEDKNGCLKEFADLRSNKAMMFAESKTLIPAMRILAKQNLIKQVSAPKITCEPGGEAEMDIAQQRGDGNSHPVELRLQVASEQTKNGMMVQLTMHTNDGERASDVRTAVHMEPGQTIVLNAKASPASSDESQGEQSATYVIVTPEVLK